MLSLSLGQHAFLFNHFINQIVKVNIGRVEYEDVLFEGARSPMDCSQDELDLHKGFEEILVLTWTDPSS